MRRVLKYKVFTISGSFMVIFIDPKLKQHSRTIQVPQTDKMRVKHFIWVGLRRGNTVKVHCYAGKRKKMYREYLKQSKS